MKSKKKKNWIAAAIGKPGSLRKKLKIKKMKKIPLPVLKKVAKKKGIIGKQARLAITLSKLRKRK